MNLSQYFTNNLNTSILYSYQYAWGTLQLGQKNMWNAKVAVSFFPLIHGALKSRSNVANSNMCKIYEISATEILKIKFQSVKNNIAKIYNMCTMCIKD